MQNPVDSRSSASGSSSPLLLAGRLANPGQRDVLLPQDPMRNPETGTIIARIEEIFAASMDALNQNRVLEIPIRDRHTRRVRLVRFPSPRSGEAKKFTALLQILHLIHEALVTATVITKRGIYYQNPELFGSQQYVDLLVDDLAFTFGSGRGALNIAADCKGLIAGAVRIAINNMSALYCNADDGGVLLPPAQAITGVDIGATFRGLVASRFHENATVGPGILITGKGYPDLSTRQFLHKLQAKFPTLPMYGLVDFDPYGVEIMLTYKYGSRSLRHEENATLNRLFWIGPRSNDVLGINRQESTSTNTSQTCLVGRQASFSQSSTSLPTRYFSPVEVTLSLTTADRSKAVRLLSQTLERDEQWPEISDLVHELQVMLFLNIKAEIQAVDEAGDLTTWLDGALTQWKNGR
ncbi:hypothetical protein NUW58_g3354 [Xylaria curta]|uniref:Uncharacterized protein n=1 Tax=Xylaria curta TaxID=42375 RepID=A0ACC1PBD6_9PEZI|nr:hypothetical protein NUW58_g3354 [Xylaria curta]